jgi:hypothetical protein
MCQRDDARLRNLNLDAALESGGGIHCELHCCDTFN